VVTQTLLGVRLQCAQCHDHPFDVWTRREFYEIAAHFGRTSLYRQERPFRILKVTTQAQPQVLWPPTARPDRPQRPMEPGWPLDRTFEHPQRVAQAARDLQVLREGRSSEQIDPALFETGPVLASRVGMDRDLDRSRHKLADAAASLPTSPLRQRLADRLLDPMNPYFTWNIVNRVWAQLLGRGIVEPTDDFRADNPPSHPELLDELSAAFIAGGYDLRSLIGAIVLSEPYQRGRIEGQGTEQRQAAEELFIASPLRRMPAETLYDSIVTAGHLDGGKYPAGTLVEKQEVTIAVPVNLDAVESEMNAALRQELAMLPADRRTYNVEGDVVERMLGEDDPLRDLRLIAAGEKEMIPAEVIEEARMRLKTRFKGRIEYTYHTEVREVDRTPRFGWSLSMAAPAPSEHFLRQFGQTERVLLGEKRSDAPTMRQALILMNGQLTNEAARVGDLEPVGRMLARGGAAGMGAAVRVAYIELLTREPSEAETSAGLAVLEAAATPAQGMADLRWSILNSHAFRYLP
jgi:hypothetical protein